jgi:signal transduction histidine kinase
LQGKVLRDSTSISRPLRLAQAGFDGYAAATPLTSHEELVGVLSAYRDGHRGPFSDEDVEFMELFASIIAAAMHNPRLFARSEELGITRERNRIAREMHDTLGSEMASLLRKVELAEVSLDQNPQRARAELKEVGSGLQNAISELRRVLAALRPLELEKDGLLASTRRLVRDFENQTSVPVTFHVEGSLPPLNPRVEMTLFRVLQECATNIHKHAQASAVSVTLQADGKQLSLTVEDNGQGFDTSNLEASGGMGLKNIRNRVETAGGTLDVASAPEKGTRVTATLPISQAQEA